MQICNRLGFTVAGSIIASAVLVADGPKATPKKVAPKRAFTLSLQAVDKQIPARTRPQFRLTLKNVSGQTQRVLNFAARPDLQHTYCKLIVTKDGKPVDLPRAVSDPGSVSETDYLKVSPGAKKVFLLWSFPDALEELQPGDYKAHISFWQNPHQSHTTRYKSQEAKFRVQK